MTEWFEKLQARLSLPEFVTLRLVVGLLMSLGCLLAFAALTEDVVEQERIVRFDRALDDTLHAVTTAQTAKIYEFISLFGSQVVLVITLIVALYYLYKRRWVQLGVWLVAIAGGEVLNLVLKELNQPPAPVYADPFVGKSIPVSRAVMPCSR